MAAAWSMHMGLGHLRHANCLSVLMTVVVIVVMRMAVATCGISPTFWFEGRVGLFHRQVHRAQHVCEHVVWLDLEVIGLELDLHMAVAQVVGRPHQVKR
jgi:hypothetical protein